MVVSDEAIVNRILGTVCGAPRLNFSDFARSKEWRKTFAQDGIIEVTDRTETTGFFMSPEYARSMAAYIEQLENDLEQNILNNLFIQRSERTNYCSGEALKDMTLSSFESHKEKIREMLDGD